METPIRLALRKKISAKFGREPQSHDDFVKMYCEIPIEIGISTLKRVFGRQGHNDCENLCSRQATQKALCAYLGYESWELLITVLACEANPDEMAKKYLALQNRP